MTRPTNLQAVSPRVLLECLELALPVLEKWANFERLEYKPDETCEVLDEIYAKVEGKPNDANLVEIGPNGLKYR